MLTSNLYVTSQLQPSVTVHKSMFHAMQGSELSAIPETQLSRFSPQRRTNPSTPYGGAQSVQIPSQAEAPQGNLPTASLQLQGQYRNTPTDWASNPNAQAGAPQQQTTDPLGVPPRTITLSENADLENVNPGLPGTKRDNAVKGGAPLGSKATGDPARALAEQSGPDTGTPAHIVKQMSACTRYVVYFLAHIMLTATAPLHPVLLQACYELRQI